MPFKNPDDKRAYQRDKMRERRAVERSQRRAARAVRAPQRAFTARQSADVRDLLVEQIDVVRQDVEASTVERARCIGYLAGVLLRAVEATGLLARVEALEIELQKRQAA